MELQRQGANVATITLGNGSVILFSYDTPVAVYDRAGGFILKTDRFFSRTTSKHVNAFIAERSWVQVRNVTHDEIANYAKGVH